MNTLLLQSMGQITSPTDRPRTAVTYLRVSTKRQAEKGGTEEGLSIPAQREANRQKAESLGAFIVKEFADKGESAKTANRPGLQAMLEYLATHKTDYVIVHKLDRLARNRFDDATIMDKLDKMQVNLVSTTEALDNSPSGSLMHGIMSSIAEFYSNNLAQEVKKGMLQKVKNGGTPSKAPLGYKNLITRDELGREIRTVIVDEERAPLIRKAFTMYATGSYTVKQLAEEMATEGLTTASTPRIASKSVTQARMNTILINPYYKGLVKYNGALHAGSHLKLVDEATWQKVQDIMKSHRQGERTRKHPHFLKSTVWCGSCHGRLLVQVSRSSTGELYHYLMCGNRHAKRNTCRQRSVQTDEVEKQIEAYYQTVRLSDIEKEQLRTVLVSELGKLKKDESASQDNIRLERDKITRKQKKLLEAHYNDSIPLEIFKEEQYALQRAKVDIDLKLAALEQNYEDVERNLDVVLQLVANVGKLYKTAPEHIKRMFNQIFFERILVSANDDVKPQKAPLFEAILSPQTKQLAISSELLLTSSKRMLNYAKRLSNELLVHPARFERTTSGTANQRSIQLSYGCIHIFSPNEHQMYICSHTRRRMNCMFV